MGIECVLAVAGFTKQPLGIRACAFAGLLTIRMLEKALRMVLSSTSGT